MSKIIRLTETQLNNIVKKVLNESPYPGRDNKGQQTPGRGGTNTSSSGAYVTPGGINFDGGRPGGSNDRTYTEQPSLRYGGNGRDPYDNDNPRYPKKQPPTSGSYETKLRSTECCKKCKNGMFKHNCSDVPRGPLGKFDSTNCVYATISDCQLNKRSYKKKKKSKK